jgi:hypothetical protein
MGPSTQAVTAACGMCAACGAHRLSAHLSVAHDPGPQGLIPTTDRFGAAFSDIVRCSACGHMQLARFPPAASLLEAYTEAESADYLPEEAGQRATARATLDMVERRVGGGALLDVGCWVGFLLAATITTFTDRVDEFVTGALYPAICAVRDRTSLMYESLVKSNRLALMWAVPFGVAITIFGPDLIRFGIGERWRSAITVLQVYGVTAAINHIGFNWTAYFRARGETRPIAVANLAATAVFLAAGIPLLLVMGLPGFALGIALQTVAAVGLRAFYLQQMFPGFDFPRHAARSFLPTVPAAAAVLVMRALEPRARTLGLALAELIVYVAVTGAATWYLESSLLREATGYMRRPRAMSA